MSTIFKRRLYRLSLASTSCFLIGILLFDLADTGLRAPQLYWFCYIFVWTGLILCFKTLETWSIWLEDTSEDTNEGRFVRNPFPAAFYIEAAAAILLIVFLLIWAITRNWPDAQESLFLSWGLFVAGGCVFMGSLSSSME